jgi:hypothetical protein
VVNILPPFTSTVDPQTPRIPLVNEQAQIVVPAGISRQIFDLGPMTAGDRLRLSILSQPGFGRTFAEPGFSLLLLDENQELFGWYQDGYTLFSQETKLIIAEDMRSMYMVVDSGTSVNLLIERAFEVPPSTRQQRIYLQFGATDNLTIRDSDPFDVPNFELAGVPVTVRDAIANRLRDLVQPYNIEVYASNSDPVPPDPYVTIYFDTTDTMFSEGLINEEELVYWGLFNQFDPRNDTLSGRAIVAALTIFEEFPALSESELGTAIGNAVAHHVGFLLGLRETTDGTFNDVMNEDANNVTNAALSYDPQPTAAPLAPAGNFAAIGSQDGDTIFLQLFGPRP